MNGRPRIVRDKSREGIFNLIKEKVIIKGNDCWEWDSSISPQGYGTTRIFGKTQTVHRLMAWCKLGLDLSNGKIFVCHMCDNRACCNPDHLFLGTNRENMLDAASKDRTSWGNKNGSAKYDLEKILEIVALFKSGLTRAEIVVKTGISRGLVCKILNGTRRTREIGTFRAPSKKPKRPVLCVTTGSKYESISEASRLTGIPSQRIHEMCSGIPRAKYALKFKFID